MFRTSGEKVAGGYIVNGMKHFISNGNRASFYLLFVQTDKSKPLAEGSTCFLLERDRPGFTIGRVHDKMGERLADNAELIFQDCFMPDENVVGTPGRGFNVLAEFFPHECLCRRHHHRRRRGALRKSPGLGQAAQPGRQADHPA